MARDKDDEKKKKKEAIKICMVDADDPKALQTILGAIQKTDCVKDTPGVVSINPATVIANLYETGILSLDRALGIGGLLGGRITNCHGDNGTGKTLTAMVIGGAVQRAGGIVAFLDAEGTFSPKFATACGLDVSKLIYVRSTPERIMAGEDFFEIMRVLVAQGVHFIIVDSATALVPSQKLALAFGEGQQATQARLMSEELQKVTSYLSANQRTHIWFTNQMRAKPMEMFGPKEESTGGKALPFYMSYGFHMYKVGDMVAKVKTQDGRFEERIVGVTVKLKITKNKTASKPLEPIEFDIYTEFAELQDGTIIEPGVNVIKDMFNVCKSLGIIEQKGAWYNFGDIRGQGEIDFCINLRQNPQAVTALRERALAAGRAGVAVSDGEAQDEADEG